MNRCGRAAMGLFSEEVTQGFYNFRREIGHISQRVYVAVWGKYRKSKPLGLVFGQSRVKVHSALTLLNGPRRFATP